MLAEDFKPLETEAECLDIPMKGVAKFIVDLPNDKSPGPDGIRKPQLFVDLFMTSDALALI